MIPGIFHAGDTVAWTENELSLYPSSSWDLTFYFLGKDGKFNAEGTSNGNGWDFEITGAISGAIEAGIYAWKSFASLTTGEGEGIVTERHFISEGSIEVVSDWVATEVFDTRSWARRCLDAVEALLEGKTTADVQSYSLGGRSISKLTPTELLDWRSFLKSEVRQEDQRDLIAKGLPPQNKVLIQF